MSARTPLSLLHVALVGLGLAWSAAPSFATDVYVDAVNGDDANSGATPASAWRTISHALSRLPVPSTGLVDVVHVAPGLYDAALGETFPLDLREHDAVQIVGSGPDHTILDGGGSGTLVLSYSLQHNPGSTGPLTLVQGLWLRNAARGVSLDSFGKPVDLTCRDLRISGMSEFGVRGIAGGVIPVDLRGVLERVEIRACAVGALVTTRSGNSLGNAYLTLLDCTVAQCGGSGVVVTDPNFCRGSRLACVRTRILDNGEHGVLVAQGFDSLVTTSAQLDDCLIAGNALAGVKVSSTASLTGPFGTLTTTLVRCTVANNATSGVDTFFSTLIPPPNYRTTLASTLLFGNGDDVVDNAAQPTIQSASYCDVGDGDFAGINGCFSADPLFRDAPNGDYRLAWGSACIDTGDPGVVAGELDLVRVRRPVDGNLDTAERSDVGAFEFAPLWAEPVAHVGGDVVLEQWGPLGGFATLFVARGDPLAVPITTPFGQSDLSLASVRNLGARAVAPGPPALRVLHVPNSAAYAGLKVTFQALATSSTGSPAFAYTNPVTVTVEP